MVHVPGVRHTAADAVSRHPTGASDQLVLPDDIATIVPAHNVLAAIRSYHHQDAEICSQSNQSAQVIESVTWDDVKSRHRK